jgi:predicted nucleic acid-binding protein
MSTSSSRDHWLDAVALVEALFRRDEEGALAVVRNADCEQVEIVLDAIDRAVFGYFSAKERAVVKGDRLAKGWLAEAKDAEHAKQVLANLRELARDGGPRDWPDYEFRDVPGAMPAGPVVSGGSSGPAVSGGDSRATVS